MLEKLAVFRKGGVKVRYYGESRLIRVMQQYYELPAAEAQGLLAGVLTACVVLWFGKSMADVDRGQAQCQDFWLLGPDRALRLWARFTDPYFDIIARLENLESSHPIHAICVGYDEAED